MKRFKWQVIDGYLIVTRMVGEGINDPFNLDLVNFLIDLSCKIQGFDDLTIILYERFSIGESFCCDGIFFEDRTVKYCVKTDYISPFGYIEKLKK